MQDDVGESEWTGGLRERVNEVKNKSSMLIIHNLILSESSVNYDD